MLPSLVVDGDCSAGLDQANPLTIDTDGDGHSDGEEVANGSHPLDPNDPGEDATIVIEKQTEPDGATALFRFSAGQRQLCASRR